MLLGWLKYASWIQGLIELLSHQLARPFYYFVHSKGLSFSNTFSYHQLGKEEFIED